MGNTFQNIFLFFRFECSCRGISGAYSSRGIAPPTLFKRSLAELRSILRPTTAPKVKTNHISHFASLYPIFYY